MIKPLVEASLLVHDCNTINYTSHNAHRNFGLGLVVLAVLVLSCNYLVYLNDCWQKGDFSIFLPVNLQVFWIRYSWKFKQFFVTFSCECVKKQDNNLKLSIAKRSSVYSQSTAKWRANSDTCRSMGQSNSWERDSVSCMRIHWQYWY